MALILTCLGIVGLAVFAGFMWLPLALLVLATASLAAGLLIDWEALRNGKPAKPSPRR